VTTFSYVWVFAVANPSDL